MYYDMFRLHRDTYLDTLDTTLMTIEEIYVLLPYV